MPKWRVILDWIFDQLYGIWISFFPPKTDGDDPDA